MEACLINFNNIMKGTNHDCHQNCRRRWGNFELCAEGNWKLWLQGNAGDSECGAVANKMLKTGKLARDFGICRKTVEMKPTIPERRLRSRPLLWQLSNSKSLPRPPSNFLKPSIVAADLYSNVCKCCWQTVDTAQRGPSFMWSHEPGVLSVARRYHRLWRVYHSYKPIQCQLHCAEQYWVFGCSPHLRGRRLWNNKLFNVPVNLSLLPFFTRSI